MTVKEVELSLPSEIKMADSGEDGSKVASVVGYAGNPVNLMDYGVVEPVVYNVDGIDMEDEVPFMLDHKTPMGVANQHKNNGSHTSHRAEFTNSRKETLETLDDIQNKVPYEASLRLTIQEVDYIPEGHTVRVNQKAFQGPLYVANKSKLREVSATLFGRDDETKTTLLSEPEDVKDLFMTVKNAKTAPPKEKKEEKVGTKVTPPPEELKEVENKEKEKKETPPVETPPNGKPVTLEHLSLMNKHPEHGDIIINGLESGWDTDRIKREIQIADIENSYPRVPGFSVSRDSDANDLFAARMAYSIGIKEETIANKVGEETADKAIKMGVMGMKESLMIAANSNGGNFSGHSDVNNMAKHVKGLVVSNGFSTIDYPNLMHKITMWQMEEHWAIQDPWSPGQCKQVNSTDFRKNGFLRPKGGKMWNGLNNEGKIEHGTFGKEDKYETELNTIGQILTFKREDIINDDVGWIEETLQMMVEGATMVPDYQMVNLMYNAESAGVIGAGSGFYTLPFTKDNLRTVYQYVRKSYIDKEKTGNDVQVLGTNNMRFLLVTGIDLEEEAWEILNQERIVAEPNATDKVGSKNYWFNRLGHTTFDNLENSTYNSAARADAWAIIPEPENMKPFYIRYLNRQTRPITETVDLPGDMLGFGVRGYWDVNLGYRPLRDGKLYATAISVPTA